MPGDDTRLEPPRRKRVERLLVCAHGRVDEQKHARRLEMVRCLRADTVDERPSELACYPRTRRTSSGQLRTLVGNVGWVSRPSASTRRTGPRTSSGPSRYAVTMTASLATMDGFFPEVRRAMRRRSLSSLQRPRRASGREDPVERDLRSRRGQADRLEAALEKTQHDLVLTHQQRAEVAHRFAAGGETIGALGGALIEGAEVTLADTRPEAFRDELAGLPDRHAGNLAASAGTAKEGKPYV
jgi:hypothetical protein